MCDIVYIYDYKMANFYMRNGGVCLGTGMNHATGIIYYCFSKEKTKAIYDKWHTACIKLKKERIDS